MALYTEGLHDKSVCSSFQSPSIFDVCSIICILQKEDHTDSTTMVPTNPGTTGVMMDDAGSWCDASDDSDGSYIPDVESITGSIMELSISTSTACALESPIDETLPDDVGMLLLN